MNTWKKITKGSLKQFKRNEMFVVKAINVEWDTGKPYTSDPYCTWINDFAIYARWPHPFDPTHYCELPTEIEK